MDFLYNNPKLKVRRGNLRQDMPKPEQVLWYWLKGKKLNNYKFRRQYSIGYYIVDFYCTELRLAIEIDGDSHYSQKAKVYDQEREDFIKSYDIRIIRFTNKEVIENIEGVIYRVLEELHA